MFNCSKISNKLRSTLPCYGLFFVVEYCQKNKEGIILNKRAMEEELKYRIKMRVREYIQCWDLNCYPVCPRCGASMEVDFQSYCDRCGQALNWKKYHKAKPILKINDEF